MYPCEATSTAGFIQQLAVSYVTNHYWFYVAGRIPAHKDPQRTDEKILRQYDIDISKWTRTRRKKAGFANLHYLRCHRFFVIIATAGLHPFFESEKQTLRDIRRHPLGFAGYSVGCVRAGNRWHPSVRIERRTFETLKRRFRARALGAVEKLGAELKRLPFEPYAPIRRQYLSLWRMINRLRAAAGLELIPVTALRLRRNPVVTLRRKSDQAP